MKSDYDVIKDFLKNENNDEIFENSVAVWIDWREYEEDIVEYFNKKQ